MTPLDLTGSARRTAIVRRTAIAAYLAVLVCFVAVKGMPLDRVGQALWILGGITAAMVGRPVGDYLRVLRDWSLFFAALLLYDRTRGIADTLGMPVHVSTIADLEKGMFGGTVPTVWLQDRLYDPGTVHWYDVGISLVYVSHFFAVWALGAVIYVRYHDSWGGYARRALGLSFAGLLTYVLLPAAPPWFAAQDGLIPPVHRISTRGWGELGLHRAGAALESAQASVNDVAALPSLHAAFSLLVVLLLWPMVHNRIVRVVLVLYPALMGFTLVYGGEHYVVDLLLGWVYAVVVVVVARAYERWRAERRAAATRTTPREAPAQESIDDSDVLAGDADASRQA